jgi:hypothetical protein
MHARPPKGGSLRSNASSTGCRWSRPRGAPTDLHAPRGGSGSAPERTARRACRIARPGRCGLPVASRGVGSETSRRPGRSAGSRDGSLHKMGLGSAGIERTGGVTFDESARSGSSTRAPAWATATCWRTKRSGAHRPLFPAMARSAACCFRLMGLLTDDGDCYPSNAQIVVAYRRTTHPVTRSDRP